MAGVVYSLQAMQLPPQQQPLSYLFELFLTARTAIQDRVQLMPPSIHTTIHICLWHPDPDPKARSGLDRQRLARRSPKPFGLEAQWLPVDRPWGTAIAISRR
jgi:hypothetical protein